MAARRRRTRHRQAQGVSALRLESEDVLADCLRTGRSELVVERKAGGGRKIFQVELARHDEDATAPTILAIATDITSNSVALESAERRQALALKISGIFWRISLKKAVEAAVRG